MTAIDTEALLAAWTGGDTVASNAVLTHLYDELCARASRYLRRERIGHTLETSALVHEVYLKLSAQTKAQWRSRDHLLAVSSQLMRRILVDHARRHAFTKRGGGRRPLPLEAAATLALAHDSRTVELDGALRDLAEVDPDLVRVVEMRYFGGLENAEVAAVLGLSERTVIRRWRLAQAWLCRYLSEGRGS